MLNYIELELVLLQVDDAMQQLYNWVAKMDAEIAQLKAPTVVSRPDIPGEFIGLLKHGAVMPPVQRTRRRNKSDNPSGEKRQALAKSYPIPYMEPGDYFNLEGINAAELLHTASFTVRAKKNRKYGIRSNFDKDGKRTGATIYRLADVVPVS